MTVHDFSSLLLERSVWFSYLLRWDALFFYEISKNGYSSENCTAFFPLYPFLVAACRLLFSLPLSVSGVALSNVFFLFSAIFLFRITDAIFDTRTALFSCFLFCFSPCSIIYSSMYTESLFSFFVLGSLFYLVRKRAILASLFMCGAAATRSNGFILAPLLLIHADRRRLPSAISSLILCAAPVGVFLGVQLHWWLVWFRRYGLVLPYSYVQKKYWEQGFLQFYKYDKNIPNVIVGAPFVALSVLVLIESGKRQYRALVKTREAGKKDLDRVRRNILLILWSVLAFQVLLSIFYIHMNMHFRFVSFNPLIYWELSEYFRKKTLFPQTLFFGYLSFGISYAVLFGAYFPPA